MLPIFGINAEKICSHINKYGKNFLHVSNKNLHTNHPIGLSRHPLKIYGCKDVDEAIDYIIQKQLLSANLLEFPGFITDDQAVKLVDRYPNLLHLQINYVNSGESLELLKKMILKSLIVMPVSYMDFLEKCMVTSLDFPKVSMGLFGNTV